MRLPRVNRRAVVVCATAAGVVAGSLGAAIAWARRRG
ncbi:MAG: hypothetical protein JWN72_2811 [Thermoleophilia bacterium]|nr:hypothetical protein [Thermoleophilia bacterium]